LFHFPIPPPSFCAIIYLKVELSRPAGTLPDPCNAGFIRMEWVIEGFTKIELRQSW
jgi:hypothetical protein